MVMTEAERDAAIQEVSDAYQANKIAQDDLKVAHATLDIAIKTARATAARLDKAKTAIEALIIKASDDATDTLLNH